MEDAGERVNPGAASLIPRPVTQLSAQGQSLLKLFAADQGGMLAGIGSHDLLTFPFAPLAIAAVVDDDAGVEMSLQYLADTVFGKGAGRIPAAQPFGTQANRGAIFQGVLVGVQPLGDVSVGGLAIDVPLKSLLHGDLLDGMGDEYLPVTAIGLTGVGAVAGTVGVGTVRAAAIAIAKGDGTVPHPLAGAGFLALARLFAQVIDVDFSQHTEHGEGQFAPGSGEVQILAHGDEAHRLAGQFVERGQQALEVTKEPVNLVHHDDIEAVQGGVGTQFLQRRPVAVPFGGDAGIAVLLDNVPVPALHKRLNRMTLGLQAVAFHLFFG